MRRFSMIATELIARYGITAMPGDRLEVSPVEALVLDRHRLARFATAADDAVLHIADPEPEPEPVVVVVEAPKRRRRAYKRRDLVAES